MMHVDSSNVCWNYMGDHCNILLVVPEKTVYKWSCSDFPCLLANGVGKNRRCRPKLTGGLFSDGSFVGSLLALINDSTDFSL